MPTNTRARRRAHDKHVANLRTPEAYAARQAAQEEGMAVNRALRSDPAAASACVAVLNGPAPKSAPSPP